MLCSHSYLQPGEAKVRLTVLKAGQASIACPPAYAGATKHAAAQADVPVETALRCSLL